MFERSDSVPQRVEVSIYTPQFPPEKNKYICIWSSSTRSIETSCGNPFIDWSVNEALLLLSKNNGTVKVNKILIEVQQTTGFIKKNHTHQDSPTAFPTFNERVDKLEKTGIGSSSCLVVSIVGSILRSGLDQSSLSKDELYSLIHLASQCANNLAQGKIGSGFDIACAVYGSQKFTRIAESRLAELQTQLQDGNPLENGLKGLANSKWLVPIKSFDFKQFRLVMVEYESGFDTRSAVKSVLRYLASNEEKKKEFLDKSNEMVSSIIEGIEEEEAGKIKSLCIEYRSLMKSLGERAGVEIEPHIASIVLDALLEDTQVVYGICPGAGGYDAIALILLANTKNSYIKSLLKKVQDTSMDLCQSSPSLHHLSLADKIKAGEQIKKLHFDIIE